MSHTPDFSEKMEYEVLYVFAFKLLVTVLILLSIIYFGRRFLKTFLNVLSYLRDHFVLWNIAFGATSSRRNISHNLRLHAYVCKTVLLDFSSVKELYQFATQMVSSDVSIETFHRVMLNYKFVIICRERIDGSLRGMCLLDQSSNTKNGQQYNVISLGLALFNNLYQGGPLLYYVLFYQILKQLLLHPFTPLYLTCKCFSYKSYLGLARTFTNIYPSYDKPFPQFERDLLTEFADKIKRPGEVFNSETFVLEREMSKIKESVAPVTIEELKNPHIKFFTDQNPGWASGHCMFCICPVTKYDLLVILQKALKRALGIHKPSNHKKRERIRKSFDRHFSYQCPSAQDKVLEFYNIDRLGNVVPMFGTSADIYAHPSSPPLSTSSTIKSTEGEGERRNEKT